MEVSDKQYEMHVLLISKSRLKSSIGTSTLMAGFALVAMVEVDVHEDTPSAILIPYAMLTALLICVHLFSLIIATRLLPELEAFINNPEVCFPHRIVKRYYSWPVQLVWYLSNIVGVFLFLVELVLVAYVKFFPYSGSVADKLHVGTATLVVVVTLSALAFPFIIVFFRSLSNTKIKLHEQKLEKALILLESINQSGTSDPPQQRTTEI